MNEIFKELAHLNVLLVEDDTQLQGVLAGLLAPYVGQIYKAQNGQDGLESFSKKRHRYYHHRYQYDPNERNNDGKTS